MRLHHGHVRAQLAVDQAQLQTDIAAAHDDQLLGDAVGRQRLGGGYDATTKRHARQAQFDRAGGQHHVLALDAHRLGI